MTARCADMDAAPEALRLERCLGLGRAISAVAEHRVRCVAPVQEPIQLLAVMDCRVAHVVAPDQLVLGIRIHVVLVAVNVGPKAFPWYQPINSFERIALRRQCRQPLLRIEEAIFRGALSAMAQRKPKRERPLSQGTY